MKTLTIVVFLAFVCAGIALESYNLNWAIEFWKISGISYCSQQQILGWTCGNLCNSLKGKVTPVHYYVDNTFKGGLSYFMSRDDANKFFITAFRGTDSTTQLIFEIMQGTSVNYDIHSIPGARVMDYFYSAYVSYLRSDFLKNFKSALATYKSYTFVFTGHSLGGALTTHAALDVILSNLVPRSQVILYNYGSPRVGNFKFAQAVRNAVPVINRLVHYKDIVPHVPPCSSNSKGECVTGESPQEGADSDIIWPAWHIWDNLFYNENSSSYVVCNGGEDPKCADQYTIGDCSTQYHGNYLGITFSCASKEVFPHNPAEDEEINVLLNM